MYLSALLYGGMAEKILDLVADSKLELLVSPELIAEVLRKFQEKGANESMLQRINVFLDYKGNMVIPKVKINICRDPNDNFLLELSQTAEADYLVSRDKDLLELPNHKWKKTKILTPEEFLPILRLQKII
ncbi:putative toxin-antitoxin system toxin component, PIN family [Candidatus Curtissbacteria bacterium]|nr:putative toxin-antitoxin system toxin component, PIN family [Candidatus Curtissbacteria bacterium]